MNDEELQAIKARETKATPGPWWDATQAIRCRVGQQMRNGKWRAKPGYSLRDAAAYAILGDKQVRAAPTPPVEEFQLGCDEYDYYQVVVLRWSAVRGDTLVDGVPKEADLAFLIHARTDIPALIAEIERLQEENARLQGRHHD